MAEKISQNNCIERRPHRCVSLRARSVKPFPISVFFYIKSILKRSNKYA